MDLKRIALTAGVAILLSLFVVFFIDAVYEMPKYETYCNSTFAPNFPIKLENQCNNTYNPQAEDSCYRQQGQINYKYDSKGCPKEAYCDYCSKDHNAANSKYNKILFYISALVGALVIIAGLYLPKKMDPISSGLIFAGIILLLQGTIRVFGDLGKFFRVIVLGLELVILLWLGYAKVIKKK